jgi:pimeloyl-ACP methyl ester carboxylesterase
MITKKIKIRPNLRLHVFDSSWQKKYPTDLTIVFIHGATGSLLTWKYQLSYFAKKYRTLAYDWRGCGNSDKASSYSFDDHYHDFLLLMKKMKISSRVILVAHSYGCLLAQRYLKEYGAEKFVNVSLDLGGNVGFWLKFLLNLPKFIQLPFYSLFLKPRNPFLTKKMVASKKTPLGVIRQVLAENKLPSLDFYLGLKTFRQKESLEWMKNYQERMLFISGREDKRVKAKHLRKINNFLPQLRIEILENTGHILPCEAPTTFNRLVEAFIEAKN